MVDRAASRCLPGPARRRLEIGLIGHTVIDTIVGPDGAETQRLGGTPLYARRALQAAGADCVVVTRGADPGDAVVVPGGPAYDSRLDHRAGTRQVLARIGLPFTPDEVREHALPALRGCTWLHLGAQSAGEFPPETLAVLAAAGHRLCLDGQGPARGPDPGPVRLRPFPPSAIAGVRDPEAEPARGRGGDGRPARPARRCCGLGAPEVVVTMGADGVVVATAARSVRGPRHRARAATPIRPAPATPSPPPTCSPGRAARRRRSAAGEAERATDLLYL